jgi:hypothetical protein
MTDAIASTSKVNSDAEWNLFDSQVADVPRNANAAEGWDLFSIDPEGVLRIQKEDEADIFETDAEAIEYVEIRAEEGSERHQKALEKHLANANAAEGWDLFSINDKDTLQIQKYDQSDKFASDDAAIEFVERRAQEGSVRHQIALERHLAGAPKPMPRNENTEEGWELVDIDGEGAMQIKKDEQSGLFHTDDQAFYFVSEQAEKGSVRHQEALERHLDDSDAVKAHLSTFIEGWELSKALNGEQRIQLQWDDPIGIFENDEDAVTFVKMRALQGSQRHQRAYALHMTRDGVLTVDEPDAMKYMLDALKELKYATTVGVFNSSAHIRALQKAEVAIAQAERYIKA